MEFSDRLADITHQFQTGDTPREIIEVLDAHVKRLLEQNVASQAIQVGSIAPKHLNAYWEKGPVELMTRFCRDQFLVLTWFRGNW